MINVYVIQRNCLQCYVARKNTIFFLRNFLSGGERELGSEGMAAVLAGVMICIWVFVQRIILIEEPSPAHSPQPSPAQTTVSRAIQPADSQPWEPGVWQGSGWDLNFPRYISQTPTCLHQPVSCV